MAGGGEGGRGSSAFARLFMDIPLDLERKKPLRGANNKSQNNDSYQSLRYENHLLRNGFKVGKGLKWGLERG